MKRIVSLVPSWTETLVEAGANVVGRTRFCIHPAEQVANIEAIGGTKSFDLEKLKLLRPDLIVMDREENTREMAELAATVAPVLATHVEKFSDLASELRNLAQACDLPALEEFAKRAQALAFAHVHEIKPALHNHSVPGVQKILRGEVTKQTPFVYLIWKDPWMSINRETFIASMLERAGFDLEKMSTSQAPKKYPTLERLPEDALVLLSSEPYPFGKKASDVIKELRNSNIALVDGESFSWFGPRAIRFLESF